MDKKSFFSLLLIGVVSFIALLFILIVFEQNKSDNITDNSQIDELGNIYIAENDVPDDEYEGDYDYELDVSEVYVGFTNLFLVYDILPLDAIAAIPDEAAAFLNFHGYSDVHNLTIIEDTIIYDKSYPYFVCYLEGVDDCFLEIRYEVSKGDFEFNIITENN